MNREERRCAQEELLAPVAVAEEEQDPNMGYGGHEEDQQQ